MPKILLIPEFDKFGGTRTFIINLLKVYTMQSYEVVMLLPKSQLDDEIKAILHNSQIRYSLIGKRKNYLNKLCFRFPASVLYDLFVALPYILKERPDLVVASIGTPGIFLGLFMLPIKFLYILHTYPSKPKLILGKSLFFGLLLNKSKIILLNSDYSRRTVLRHWLNRRNSKFVQHIYNTVKESLSSEIKQKTPDDKISRIITLGHVTWYKNPQTWLDAAQIVIEKLNHIHIEFIWAGDGDLLHQYIELAKSINPSKIKFIGHKKNVDELYKTGTVYFQPSRMESQGLAVMEAMSWSLPCVVSKTGGLPESIKDGETGYVTDVDDAEMMADKIIYLIINQDIAAKMGHAARTYYEKMYSYPVWEEHMKQIHEQLMETI